MQHESIFQLNTNIGFDKPQDIHIWMLCPDCIPTLTNQSILSAHERERARSFIFKRDQIIYIAAHVSLRLILSRYINTPPQDVIIDIETNGKPFEHMRSIHFSLSHTKELIAIAVSHKHVGIDIEKQIALDQIENVANQFMTTEELQQMMRLSKERQKSFFYSCWVQKEAWAKATGSGIDDQLRNISVMHNYQAGVPRTLITDLNLSRQTWWLNTISPSRNHIGAICVENSCDESFSITYKYNKLFENTNLRHYRCEEENSLPLLQAP